MLKIRKTKIDLKTSVEIQSQSSIWTSQANRSRKTNKLNQIVWNQMDFSETNRLKLQPGVQRSKQQAQYDRNQQPATSISKGKRRGPSTTRSELYSDRANKQGKPANNCQKLSSQVKHEILASMPKHNIRDFRDFLLQKQAGSISPGNDCSELFWHPSKLRIPAQQLTGKSSLFDRLGLVQGGPSGPCTSRQPFHSYKKPLPIPANPPLKPSLTETSSTISTLPPPQKLPTKRTPPARHCLSLSDFAILKQIGEGKFSKVMLVRHRLTGFICALKSIRKDLITQSNMLSQVLRELKISLFAYHPHLVTVYGYFHDEDNLYMLEELGCDGQLYNRIKQKGRFSEEATAFIVRQVLEVVKYLHENKIVHRDIKPENIVIAHGNIKLCDLGWSVYAGKNQLRETLCGTPLYSSPELLQGQSYNEKIDLWAIGILAYELYFGHTPFNIKLESQLTRIITDQIAFPQPCKASQQFKDFLHCILQKDPSQRLSCSQLLTHPFILKYRGFETCQQLCSF